MRDIQNIFILTGAGISVESGLPAFRTMANGDMGWDTGLTVHPLEDVATPDAFRRNPRWCRPSTTRGGKSCGTWSQTLHTVRWRGSMRNARRASHRHPECRRPARTGRSEARAPHARGAPIGLVPRLRRARALGGRAVEWPGLPQLRRGGGECAPTSSGSRDSYDRSHVSDAALHRPSLPERVSARRALGGRAGAGPRRRACVEAGAIPCVGSGWTRRRVRIAGVLVERAG
jgi:hypothetical protein